VDLSLIRASTRRSPTERARRAERARAGRPVRVIGLDDLIRIQLEAIKRLREGEGLR
jgi:hypothetical protein